MPDASDPGDRTLVDHAMDLFVYAPVGLALEARELIPKLAERGRGQVALARLVGQLVVRKGQREAERFVARTQGRAEEGPPPTGSPAADRAPAATETFPIAGYDDLRATEILPLLDGLDAGQLDAVAAHEASHRARRTILGKIDQLRG